MRLLFTRSNKILSKLIRSITEEPVSHVALQFDFPGISLVIHSNLLGVHIESLQAFKKSCDFIKVLEATQPDDANKINGLLSQYEGSSYDYGAFFFMGLTLIGRRVFKAVTPKINLWDSTGMFLCTEWVTEVINGEKDSLITPFALYETLRSSDKWIEKEVSNEQ